MMSSKEIALEVVELLKPMIGDIRADIKGLDERVGEVSERVESLDERMGEMSERVESLDERMGTLSERVESLDERMGEMSERVESLDERMGTLSERVESLDERVKRIEIVQENEILPRLKHIEECYTSTCDKFREELDNLDKMKSDIYVLNNCVRLYSKTKKRKYKNKCIRLEG